MYQDSNQIIHQVAHFHSELVAYFHPESMAHFEPEYLPSDCNEITLIMNRIKSANGSDSKMVTFDKNTLLTDYRNEGKSGLTGIDKGDKITQFFNLFFHFPK